MERNDLIKLKRRIDFFCQNKVNAFSPTISPAPKSFERNEIESIYEGVSYFLKRGINEFVFQRKYMGSYCDIYLHKELRDSYFVSRNGHKITHVDMEKAWSACSNLHSRFDWSELQLVVIQSELMPWSVLGKGLIEDEFKGYLDAHQVHYNYLKNSELYQKIDIVKASEAYQEFINFKNTHSEKELKQKYASHIIRQYSALEDFKILNMEEYEEGIKTYAKQIEFFGNSEELYFKPFNILKKIYQNGNEEIVNDNLSYSQVNDDAFLHLKIENGEDFEQKIEKVYEWYHSLINEMDEGIMIKPRTAFIKGLPPAFKVRNNQYLTMIYGVNFLADYRYNMGRRKIEKKLECSINDWMINYEILRVKYSDINAENYLLKNLVLDRILGEEIESQLDTRL